MNLHNSLTVVGKTGNNLNYHLKNVILNYGAATQWKSSP